MFEGSEAYRIWIPGVSVCLSLSAPNCLGQKHLSYLGLCCPLALQGWRGTPSGGWRKTLGWGGASGRSFKGQTGSKMWRRRVLVKEGTYPLGLHSSPPPYSSADPGSRSLARQEGVCTGGQARQTAAGRAAAPHSCTLPTSS